MARTKRNAMLIEEARQKIKTTQLVNRLTDHALGNLKKPMETSQVTAALGLLKKALPDLSQQAVTGDNEGGPITVKIVTGIDREGS